ncbi:TPM domain-containing protein [Flavobacterium oreochromis]|uniref:TPM domain-containing protein n=1 Tax=Flavobacterium oreochromis TaxID=2906078 RepID=A0ABW8PBR7_9FLAO|nr:TPM domain-containing protein [Flavobacterium oreochromis]OWP75854.1 methanol dehydrogenase [Flavobacterium oreochromis]
MKNIKPQIKKYTLGLFLFVLLHFVSFSWAQFDIPPKPKNQTSVYDYAKILSNSENKKVEEKLIKYSDSTSTQIIFISIETLKGENIGLLAPRWAHTWGIGDAKKDNGVILLLAKKERKIWISPGYGVEDRLTAGVTGEIVRNYIIPQFKKGNYYAGVDEGTDAIIQALKGKFKAEQKKEEGIDIEGVLLFLFIVIVLLIIISKSKGNGNNHGGGGGLDLGDIIILSRMGRGGSSWSSGETSWGDSGGFGGGFGGGGFSGGGAGGDW